ncbi:hypothetical protein SAMN05216264_1154 [Pseudomonas marincola]|nr:hypothetical protein SAMN05216264_1154 [Pseudomonas marincola]
MLVQGWVVEVSGCIRAVADDGGSGARSCGFLELPLKARQSNYVASLRLEGFQVTQADAVRKLPTRESVLSTYRNKSD